MEPIQECQEALPPSSSPVAPSEGGGESTEIEQVSPPPSQEVASSDSSALLSHSHNPIPTSPVFVQTSNPIPPIPTSPIYLLNPTNPPSLESMEPIQECQEALPPSSSPVAPSEGGGESTEIEQVSPPPSQEVASSDSSALLSHSHNPIPTSPVFVQTSNPIPPIPTSPIYLLNPTNPPSLESMEPIRECQEALPPSSSPVAPSEGGGESTEIEQVSPPPSQEVASSDSIRLGSPLHRSHNIGLPQQSTGSVLMDLVLNTGKLLKALREILNGVQQLLNIYCPVLNESGSLNSMAQSVAGFSKALQRIRFFAFGIIFLLQFLVNPLLLKLWRTPLIVQLRESCMGTLARITHACRRFWRPARLGE